MRSKRIAAASLWGECQVIYGLARAGSVTPGMNWEMGVAIKSGEMTTVAARWKWWKMMIVVLAQDLPFIFLQGWVAHANSENLVFTLISMVLSVASALYNLSSARQEAQQAALKRQNLT